MATTEQAATKMLEATIRGILRLIGENPDRDGLKETPARVAKMFYSELFAGYKQDPTDVFKTFEVETSKNMIVLRGISFYSQCEHHMLPFFGEVDIAYIPGDRVLGLSKFARLIDIFAHRLQVQERMTEQITDAIWENLVPEGCGVIVSAEHLCMSLRGVRRPHVRTITSAVRGSFRDDPSTRAEFLSLVKGV